ncbi:MAG: hypothetical protein R6X33_15005 [Candidatus Brocadiia bacterium]
MGNETDRLLRGVALRRHIALVGRCFHRYFLVLAALYALFLAASRLLALVPDVFAPLNLVTLLAGAGALAVAFHHRPTRREVARLVDDRARTEDLFLTRVLLAAAPGEYKPLVVQQAEQVASNVRPGDVLSYEWQRPAGHVAGALVLLVGAVLFLPQLDPFGRAEARERAAERRRQLRDSRKANQMRLEQLRAMRPEEDLSPAVKNALEDLKQTFNQAKPKLQDVNRRRLRQEQARLAELWRKKSEQKLKEALSRRNTPQRFGQSATGEQTQWRKQLEKGDPSGVKKEVEELRKLARKLQSTVDPAEKQEIKREMQKRLKELSNFAGKGLGSAGLDAALGRALDQLAMSEMEGLSAEALKGLEESLELTEEELEALAQSLRDMDELGRALEACRNAQFLNKWEELDGERCSQCESMTEYAELYRKLTAGRCSKCGGKLGAGGVCVACGAGGGGIGPGTGGYGRGQGGVVPEGPEAETDVESTRTRSAVQAGKILLSIKSRDVPEAGEARVEYEERLREVKEGVSEAVVNEEIPPAYHDAVKSYFDSLE